MTSVPEAAKHLRARADSFSRDAQTLRNDPAVQDVPMAIAYATIAAELRDAANRIAPDSLGYYEGVRDGIRAHAIHKDGDLLVGALQRPIERVLFEVRQFEARGDRWYFG